MSLVEFNPQVNNQAMKSQSTKESARSNSTSGAEFSKALKSVYNQTQLSLVSEAKAGVESDLKRNKILTGIEKEEYKKEEDQNLFAMIRKVEKKLEEIKKEEKRLKRRG